MPFNRFTLRDMWGVYSGEDFKELAKEIQQEMKDGPTPTHAVEFDIEETKVIGTVKISPYFIKFDMENSDA